MKSYRNRNRNWKMGLLVLLIFALLGTFLLYKGGYFQKEEAIIQQELQEEEEEFPVEELIEPEEETYDRILPQYEEKYGENEDLVGWIRIDNTNIDYPVMQASDNDYYLHRDFEENYFFDGLPFLDFRNLYEGDLHDNSLIYGHNMGRKGTMFTELMRYTNIDFYKKAPLIEFDTIYRPYLWKVIAVAEANTDPRYGEVFEYYNYIKAKDESQLDWYLEELRQRSYYHTDVDVEMGDKLLTLQTCTNDKYDTKLIVVARMLRPGESSEVDVDKAEVNPNRVLPR